jgi:hypothetical protein
VVPVLLRSEDDVARVAVDQADAVVQQQSTGSNFFRSVPGWVFTKLLKSNS